MKCKFVKKKTKIFLRNSFNAYLVHGTVDKNPIIRFGARLCKEPSHIPLKCDEVKNTDAARLYLEEKMTEALVRKCWSCGRTFFKEDGCNKMSCVCGAQMCYICDKPVNDYRHFEGQGGGSGKL